MEVEAIDIENVPLFVAGVGLQVRPISILRSAVQVVISLDEFGHLLGDIGQFFHRELILIRSNFFLSEEAQEAQFVLKQKEKRSAAAFRATTRPAHSMDVVIGVIRWVKLDNPIDLGKVKTSLGDICA